MAEVNIKTKEKRRVADVLLNAENIELQEMPIFVTVPPDIEATEFESLFEPDPSSPEIHSLPSPNGYKVYTNGDQPADIYENLITEDEEPVDNIPSEKQQRLLVEPIHSSKHISGDFLAAANVGIFDDAKVPAIVPDMFLSLGVKIEGEITKKENRSYFLWKYGKPPEIVVESVSNKKGNEKGTKFERYAEMGVKYYVILDHGHYAQNETLMVYELQDGEYVARDDYCLPDLNLSLQFWDGTYEKVSWDWIRWCTLEGDMLLTGEERAEQADERAEQVAREAEQADERAEQATREAEQATREAEQEQVSKLIFNY